MAKSKTIKTLLLEAGLLLVVLVASNPNPSLQER
jgi:hypothetical protein